MSEALPEVSLEQVAELLVDPQQREKLRRWLEEQAGEWTGKPWLAKGAVRALDKLVSKLLARMEDLVQERVQERLQAWQEESGLRGKLTRQMLRVVGFFLEQRGQKARELLVELDRVLAGGKPSTPEVALVARQMLALDEVRVELGDKLEQVLEMVEALAPDLPLVEWDEKFDPATRVGSMLLHTPLVGRKGEMERLRQFLQEDRQPFFLLSAPGGQGKTKLALELCRWADGQGWQAWFLAPRPTFDDWSKLRLDGTGGLVVVDYALSHHNRRGLVEWLNTKGRDLKLKVLLLEREGWAEELVRQLSGSGMELSSALSGGRPYALPALGGEVGRELFRAITGVEPPIDLEGELGGNALLIVLAARMYREDPERFKEKVTRDEVLSHYLEYLYRYLEDKQERRQVLTLALVATLVRGLRKEDLSWLCREASRFGLPEGEDALLDLLEEARAALLGVRAKGEAEDETKDVSLDGMQPDLAASAFLAKEYFAGRHRGRLWRHVERLLPHRPADVVLTLSLFLADLPEEYAAQVQEVCAQTWEWLRGQEPQAGRGDYLVALVRLLAGSELEPPPRLPERWFRGWLEVADLSSEQVVALTQLAFICSGGHTLTILPLVAGHPAFRGALVASFLQRMVLHSATLNTRPVAIQVLDEVLSGARSHAKDDLYLAALEVECFPERNKPKALLRRAGEEGIRLLAAALANAVGDDRAQDHTEGWLEELRALHEGYGREAAVRESLAKALTNAVFHDRAQDHTEGWLEELRALHRAHPEAAVREELAKALFNAFNNARKAGDRAQAQQRLDELWRLFGEHPGPETGEPLLRALWVGLKEGLARAEELTLKLLDKAPAIPLFALDPQGNVTFWMALVDLADELTLSPALRRKLEEVERNTQAAYRALQEACKAAQRNDTDRARKKVLEALERGRGLPPAVRWKAEDLAVRLGRL